MDNALLNILAAHNSGEALGIYSVCSANRYVLEAAMRQAGADDRILLIESTSNQVDQFGGYTGMTPAMFVKYLRDIAARMEFPFDRIVLGGDHLGPNVWQNETAKTAYAKARVQIQAYLQAGFSKIHLDTSMRCADDPGEPLLPQIIAERAADLCETAEEVFLKDPLQVNAPLYVIGTEVPIPGGAQDKLADLQPSSVEHTRETIELTRQAFLKRDLSDAWERVIAVVVQPGVEFGDSSIIDYRHERAAGLVKFIETVENLVYEAHSTDYQTKNALRQMVEDHFAILKVGPWLTFAFREAVFALAAMEKEWLSCKKSLSLSHLVEVIEMIMKRNPQYWQKHYHGNKDEQAFARKFSYSDRIRYYWPDPDITRALQQLLNNLSQNPLPFSLLSQYLPLQYQAVREGQIENKPLDFIHHKIMEVTSIYSDATRAEPLQYLNTATSQDGRIS